MTDDGNAPTMPDTKAPAHVATSASTPPSPDPRFRLRSLLGKGGMGEVWLAHDVRIDREIAIKLMRSGISSDGTAVARFLREARVQGRLEHPSVVPVHDLAGDEQAPYFAMKRLTGKTLAEVLGERDQVKWPRRTLLARFVDVCLAVEFAHQRGVVHRDLKPANIMLGDFGEVYVLDWGLARIAASDDLEPIRASDLRLDAASGQTEAGAMLGTPGYMAPEQVRGEVVDRHADIFALGCILYELLSGRPAVPRDNALEVTLSAPQHRPSASSPDVPPELDDACAKATAAAASARFASARELANEVQRFLDGDRDLERRRTLAAGHAARAGELVAQGAIAARAQAMQEAGSAIALDASNRDAQAILARLLLEPPATTPPEVERKIDDERQLAARAVLRRGMFAYLFGFILVVVAWGLGLTGEALWPAATIGLCCLGLVALCATIYVRRTYVSTAWQVSAMLGQGLLLCAIGVGLGPFFVLPILVFGSQPIMLTALPVRLPGTVFLLHVLGIVLPLTLELAGVVPRTFSVTSGALELHPQALQMGAGALLFVFSSVVLLQLLTNTFILDRARAEQDRLRERLHVQSWQLGQLVRAR